MSMMRKVDFRRDLWVKIMNSDSLQVSQVASLQQRSLWRGSIDMILYCFPRTETKGSMKTKQHLQRLGDINRARRFFCKTCAKVFSEGWRSVNMSTYHIKSWKQTIHFSNKRSICFGNSELHREKNSVYLSIWWFTLQMAMRGQSWVGPVSGVRSFF